MQSRRVWWSNPKTIMVKNRVYQMRIKKRPMSIQSQTERNLVKATVEAEVQEGEYRGIRGNMDTLLGVN